MGRVYKGNLSGEGPMSLLRVSSDDGGFRVSGPS